MTVLLVAGKVIVVESVPESVSVLVTDKVLALVRVNVPVVLVTVRPLYVLEVRADGMSALTIARKDGTDADPSGDARK
jgi:hypothetical protein